MDGYAVFLWLLQCMKHYRLSYTMIKTLTSLLYALCLLMSSHASRSDASKVTVISLILPDRKSVV